MTIVACIYTKEIRGGAPRAFAASKIIVSKVGVAHKVNFAVIVLPYRAFLILQLT